MSACLSAYPACRSNGRTRARTAARGRGRTDGRGRADGRLSETQKSDERSIRGGVVKDERGEGVNRPTHPHSASAQPLISH